MPLKLIWSGILVALIALYLGQKLLWQSAGLDSNRYPSFAGSWYPGNKAHLQHVINTYLEHVRATPVDLSHIAKLNPSTEKQIAPQKLIAIVAPHAAFRYSGQAQAYCYQLIKEQAPGRIFILAAGHSKILAKGAILPHAKSFDTPLGEVKLDNDCIDKLKNCQYFSVDNTAHKLEHAVELQLPYIAYCLPKTKIVPLIIGKVDDVATVQSIASSIKSVMQPGDLLLVSTDFTHYGRFYRYVPFKDNIPANIVKLDREAFSYLKQRDLAGFMRFKERTGDTICGYTACLVMLALLPADYHCTVLDYFTSNDAMGTPIKSPRDKSISYISLVYWH